MPSHTDFFDQNTFVPTKVSTGSAGPLDQYVPSPVKPWNERRVAHLYRRLGFGATPDQIQQGLQMTPSQLVDQLLNVAAALGPPDPPYWANWTSDEYNGNADLFDEHRKELRARWYADMLDNGIRPRMALFWHNHFVTELLVYACNNYMWSYYSLLHEYAFGNFRDFTIAMGKNPAMLVYLNGNLNEVGEPNENYARELMELFTMGEGNGYTQEDVVEMSRALTGYQASFNDCFPSYLDPTKFDDSPKTIFGVTDNFGFDAAHNLIFTERPMQVSEFITTKIYRHFVHDSADTDVVAGLAATFRDNDWELLPVIKQLFKSEHFFEEHFINTKIKSPLDVFVPILKMTGVQSVNNDLPEWAGSVDFYTNYTGQLIVYGPPNVAGWPGHRSWLNESRLTRRWQFSELMLSFYLADNGARELLRDLAKNLTNDSNDPEVITVAMVEFLMGQALDPILLDGAVSQFKAGIPSGYFDDGTWNLNWDEVPDQVVNLMSYLVRLPEFQLT